MTLGNYEVSVYHYDPFLYKEMRPQNFHDFIQTINKTKKYKEFLITIYSKPPATYNNDCRIRIRTTNQTLEEASHLVEKYLEAIEKYKINNNDDWVAMINNTQSPYTIYYMNNFEDIESLCKSAGYTASEFLKHLTSYNEKYKWIIIDETKHDSNKPIIYSAYRLDSIDFNAVLDCIIKEEKDGD